MTARSDERKSAAFHRVEALLSFLAVVSDFSRFYRQRNSFFQKLTAGSTAGLALWSVSSAVNLD